MRFLKWYNVYDGHLVAVCDDDFAFRLLFNMIMDPQNFDDDSCVEISESEYDHIFDTCKTDCIGGWNACRIYSYEKLED